MRAIAINVGVLVLTVVATTALGEAALRAVVVMPLPRVQPEVRYVAHPVRRFTLRPRQEAFTYGVPVRVDDRGFRSNGSVPAGGSARVLALGDSFTFGLGVRDDETWPARLEQALRAAQASQVDVVNAGTISYGVFQELDLLKTSGLALKPGLVVHALYWNDFMNPEPPPASAPSVVTPDGYFVWDQPAPREKAGQRLNAALSQSALFFTLKQVAKQFMARESTGYSRAYEQFLARGLTPEEWRIIEGFYRDLLSHGESAGFSTVVLVMPVNDLVVRPDSLQHPYVVEARRLLERLGIPYVDGFEEWSKADLGGKPFLPQGPDAHLNADGYRHLAGAVARRLTETSELAVRLH